MVPRILLCLALLSSSGCAYMATRQTCNITSDPTGASDFLVDSPDEQGAGTLLGTTACRKPIQQGMTTAYLRADLAGCQSAVWPLPDSMRSSHHFTLEPAVSVQVAGELASYPNEYVRAALDVLGKCDLVMASPPMLSATAAASANTANENLKLDYPDWRASALARAQDATVDELRDLTGIPPSDGHVPSTPTEAAAPARHPIEEIKQALGVR